MSSLAPMRPSIVTASAVTQESYTVREAVEWWKTAYYAQAELEVVAEQEVEFLSKQFVRVVELTLKDDKLPAGPLGQFIASVAIMEVQQKMVSEALSE